MGELSSKLSRRTYLRDGDEASVRWGRGWRRGGTVALARYRRRRGLIPVEVPAGGRVLLCWRREKDISALPLAVKAWRAGVVAEAARRPARWLLGV